MNCREQDFVAPYLSREQFSFSKGVISMKRLFVILLVFNFCFSASGQGVQMVPLETFVQRNDLKADNSLRYVLMRCASLYLVLAGLTSDVPEMQETSKQFSLRAETMGRAAKLLIPGHGEFVTTQAEIMVVEYAKKAQTARALTGNVFDDPVLRQDTEFCKAIPI